MAKPLPDGPIDTLGLREAMLAVPDHLATAGASGPVSGLPAAVDVDHVVVVAPAAGRTAADIARVMAAPVATIPVIVHPDDVLPTYVAARTFVVVASLDDDPVAVSAVGAVSAAGARGLVMAPVGSGLAAEAERCGLPVLATHVPVPVARAAVGVLAVHLLAVLEQLGQYAGTESAVASAVTQIERRRDELVADGSGVVRLARRIGRLLPIFYGGDDLAGIAAEHWKRQVNLNAKAASFAGTLPGIAWDEVSGWGQHGDMTRQVFTLVTLRHDHEAPRAPAAMDVVEELVEEVVHERHEVRAEGNGPLAQVLDLLFQGDLLSWHLAQELEIDPGPTAAVSAVWSMP